MMWEIIQNCGPWIAHCPELRVTAQGETYEDMRRRAIDITRDQGRGDDVRFELRLKEHPWAS